jgi:hypothetical protein
LVRLVSNDGWKGECVNLQARIERLEIAVANSWSVRNSPDLPVWNDEQLSEALQRFLDGESLKAIARSQGQPWEPLPADDSSLPQVSDEELREGIRRLLAPSEATATVVPEVAEPIRESEMAFSDWENEDGPV